MDFPVIKMGMEGKGLVKEVTFQSRELSVEKAIRMNGFGSHY